MIRLVRKPIFHPLFSVFSAGVITAWVGLNLAGTAWAEDMRPVKTGTDPVVSTSDASPDMRSPLEYHPPKLFNFNTANLLPARTLQLSVGTHQTDPNGPTSGTGNQLYFGGFEWGLSDRVQLGLRYQYFEDPPGYPINGTYPPTQVMTLSGSAKVKLYEAGRFSVAAVGSVEQFWFKSDLFNSRNDRSSEQIVPSLHIPFTFTATPNLQLHLTPSVSAFADSINGIDFFGTVASLGAGFSWKPTERWLAFGSVLVPFGPGGNTISNTQAIVRTPIWTVGTRFNFTPKGALEFYATNGFGATPATNILPFFPDGNVPLFGARIIYTPGHGPGFRPNYRGISAQPLSARNLQLQQDGFTLASADTLSAGTVLGTGAYGTYGDKAGAFFISPDHDGQIEAILEQYAVDGSVGPTGNPSTAPRYMFGAKLRFLDQNNGSPVSLSVRALIGRNFAPSRVGVFYIETPAGYKVNPRLALTVSPKFAAFGSQRKFGLGLGLNYELFPGLQMIGEVTPVSGGNVMVWAAGLRYGSYKSPVSMDLHATNAIGRYGLGTMVGQSEPKIAIGLNIQFGVRRPRLLDAVSKYVNL